MQGDWGWEGWGKGRKTPPNRWENWGEYFRGMTWFLFLIPEDPDFEGANHVFPKRKPEVRVKNKKTEDPPWKRGKRHEKRAHRNKYEILQKPHKNSPKESREFNSKIKRRKRGLRHRQVDFRIVKTRGWFKTPNPCFKNDFELEA